MAEKVTIMRLKVDLQCWKCYKKVKNVLCKFPQIRDQEFDEKKNIVTIKVVCCSPEKIRDMLCCKGCGAIKSIEIVEPPKPPKKTDPAPKPKPDPPPKPATPPPKPESPPVIPVPIGTCCDPCSEGRPGGPCLEGYGRTCCVPCSEGRPGGPCLEGYGRTCCVQCSEGRPGGPCVEGYGRTCCVQCSEGRPDGPCVEGYGRTCCGPCSEGRPGGPCFVGYGRPPPCYKGYFYVRPVYDIRGGGQPCYVPCYDQYFNEDNPTGCTIM